MEKWQIEMIKRHELKKGDFILFEITQDGSILFRCADYQGNSHRFSGNDNKLFIGTYVKPMEKVAGFTDQIQQELGLKLEPREMRKDLVIFDVL